MAKWFFNVACKDEADLASGHKRKKEGDIISVKPGTATEWGTIPSRNALIVPVEGLTKEEAHDLCKPQYEDGSLNPIEDNSLVDRLPDTEYEIDDIVTVQGWAYWCKKTGTSDSDPISEFEKKILVIINDGTVQWKCKGKKSPKMTAKRRFKFPLDKIKSDIFPGLDIARVNDPDDLYQPLRDGNIVIDAAVLSMVKDTFNDKFIKKAVDPFTKD